MTDISSQPAPAPRGRLLWLDIARGVALIAMASYHFLWDLGDFGYIDPGYPASGWPKIYARCIASTFLFLAGFSLVLAHGKGIRWKTYWTRLARIIAAAALVSLGSYLFMPQGLIFFGILHAIAVMSVIGLAFLIHGPTIIALAGAAALAAPHFLASASFNTPWLWWLGLSTEMRLSFDYVPLLPWLGPFLFGMAASKIWISRANPQSVSVREPLNRPQRALAFISRHSLAFYLIHQPVMISLLYLFSLIMPAPTVDPSTAFTNSCEKSCVETRDAPFCARFCGCALDRLSHGNMLGKVVAGKSDEVDQQELETLRIECTQNAE